MNRLGLRLPLVEGEMPTSLVSRLARLHRSTPRDFCSDMGLQWPHICSAHPEQLSRLAKLADVSLPELLRWSAPLLSPCRYRVGAAIASTGVFRRAVTRICPRCVLEAQEAGLSHGPIQRVDWLVLGIHACSRHGTPLLRLPNAGHAHDTYDLLAQIARHQTVICNAAETAVTMPATSYEDAVTARIWDAAPQDWLSQLELQQLHRACLTLGSALLFGSGLNSTTLDPSQGRAALARGYSALRGGPPQLVAVLAELKAGFQTERPYFSTDIGDFYSWLKAEHDDPALADLCGVVRGFIFDNYPIRAGQSILGETMRAPARMTFGEARKVSGIARARMATTLGHFRETRPDRAMPVTDVSLTDIKTVGEFWGSLRNLKDAAEELGIHPAQIKGLIAVGVLDAVQFNSALRYVTCASIAAVLQKIASLPSGQASAELLPIADFSQSRCISMASMLKSVLADDISGVFRNVDADGVRSILIDNAELPLRQRRRHSKDMSILEAAEHLQISAAAIRALRDAGYLEQIRRKNPDTNHQRALITFKSVEKFESRFETIGQIATRIGVRPMHLAKRLDEDGIEPVTTMGRLVRAYERDVVG